MKKVIMFITVLALSICSAFALCFTSAAADAPGAWSTSIWKPHRYMASTWAIPTSMSYSGVDGSVTFIGSLNAGIATTGFSCSEGADITNFSVDIGYDNLQSPDKLSWLCYSLFDAATLTNNVNSMPVYAPFNVGDGYSYQTTPYSGLIVMLQPQGDAKLNILLISKRVNIETGEFLEDGWQEYDSTKFVSQIILDNGDYSEINLTIEDDGTEGLILDINGGDWTDAFGKTGAEYGKINFGVNLAPTKTFFNDGEKDAYFQFVTMYSDEESRQINAKVSNFCGKKASDGTLPDYLEAKVLTEGNISAKINAESMGIEGIYPMSVNKLTVTKFDAADGNFADVKARATSLNMELIDYFRVIPKINELTVPLNAAIEVSYTLQTEGYENFSLYYINSDDEVVSIPSAMGKVENGIATISIDNQNIGKVVIYGKKPAPAKETGCGSEFSVIGSIGIITSVLALLAITGLIIMFKKKNIKDNGGNK